MPGARRPTNDQFQALLTVGPFGGIDPTTEPFYVNQSNFVDMVNLLPNRGYGGYVTAPGRQLFTHSNLPGQCKGMQKFIRAGAPNGFIYAVDIGVESGYGALYYNTPGGVPQLLTLPAGASLTFGLQYSMVVYGQWCFLVNGVDVPLKIDQNLVVTYWGIVAPTTAPTGAATGSGPLTGTYYYTVTFGNGTIQESGQGYNTTTQQTVVSAAIVATSQDISLTGIPVSTDPQVTVRNIYRLGGGNGTWNLVGTIDDNTTTTYTDSLADGDVLQTLVVFRQPPLPFKVIEVFQNCIFGYVTTENPGYVYYSNYDEPWGFNLTVQSLPVGNNSLNDQGVGLAAMGSTLAIINADSLYALYGNNSTNFVTEFIERTGGVASTAVISGYGQAWWLSRQGFYVWSGNSAAVSISDGNFQVSNIKAIIDSLTDNDLSQATCFIYDRMIGLSFPTRNMTYIYDLRTTAWYPLSIASDQFFSDPNGDYPLTGQNLENTGEIDTWFAAPGDFDNDITAYILSGVTDSGVMQGEKNYRYVQVEAVPQDAILGVLITSNPGLNQYQQNYALDISTGGPVYQFSVPMTILGRSVQLRVTVISNQEVHIQKAAIYGEVKRMFIQNDV